MVLQIITSKIARKIGVLVAAEVIFIIVIFSMLASIVSENVLIGHSIDVSGRNRFLVSNTLFKTLNFIKEPSTNTKSELNKSMEALGLNILALNGNGTVSIPGRELEPLPIELGNLWKITYNKWQIYERFVSDKILSANSPSNSSSALSPNNLVPMSIDPNIIEELEIRGLDILDSADLLTRHLAEKSQDISSSALFLQIIFCLATIGVVLGIFWIIIRTLKPIRSLEYATSQIRQGNFDLELLKVKGNDELSNLSRSFNEMVESLKANDTMQKEFLSIASHELKTPIQSILGLVQGVKKGYINPDESFDRIMRNIRRLQRLVDEILDVSRIESNALFLKMENVRVNKLIMDAVNKIKESLQYDDGITIEANLDTTRDIEINADANRITQVFVSVIGNAIKFTPKGTVRIETNFNHSRKTVEIIVTDNGDGIPEEIIPDLFNKFIAKSKDGNKHGIGLELYISKAIVDGHKGRISARNNGSGKSGSSMTIVLPMYDDHL